MICILLLHSLISWELMQNLFVHIVKSNIVHLYSAFRFLYMLFVVPRVQLGLDKTSFSSLFIIKIVQSFLSDYAYREWI